MSSRSKNVLQVVLSIAICEAAGGIGALFTTPAIGGWYASLIKPSFNPPNWIFGPVWTTLFALMGIALYLVWRKKDPTRHFALSLFALQLVLNVLWSIIFFGWHSLAGASWEIVLLWISIALTLAVFWKIEKAAGYLLVPYLAWVSFAAILTFSILKLN